MPWTTAGYEGFGAILLLLGWALFPMLRAEFSRKEKRTQRNRVPIKHFDAVRFYKDSQAEKP